MGQKHHSKFFDSLGFLHNFYFLLRNSRVMSIYTVKIFWEGHKIWKKNLLFLKLLWNVKTNWRLFQSFVAFSEYLNFNFLVLRNIAILSIEAWLLTSFFIKNFKANSNCLSTRFDLTNFSKSYLQYCYARQTWFLLPCKICLKTAFSALFVSQTFQNPFEFFTK